MAKIIKNVSGNMLQILNRDIANDSFYDVEPHLWLELAKDTGLHSLVETEDLVVNDGNDDLPSNVGIAHIININGIVKAHNDITILASISENAPEIYKISNALIGFRMEIGDETYGQSRIDNYAGGKVDIELHMAIDNSEANKWVQFELSYWTTNGFNDKQANVVTGTQTIGPVEVPTTSWRIFRGSIHIPEEQFSNGEKYLFVGIKRVVATGKTAPTNNPVILRYCKDYYEKPEA